MSETGYVRGPSLWAGVSGLRVTCAIATEIAAEPEQLEAELALIRQAIPIAGEAPALASAAELAGFAAPRLGMVLALAEVLVRDFAIAPQPGEVIACADGQAVLFIPCEAPQIGRAALGLALGLVNALVAGASAGGGLVAEFQRRYLEFRRFVRPHKLDQTTIALARSAAARGIPCTRLAAGERFVQLGHGRKGRRLKESATDALSTVAFSLTSDKLATNRLLERAGIPTPGTQVVLSPQHALQVAAQLGFPLVVKPRSGGKGKDVSVNLRNRQELLAALKGADRFPGGAIVERYIGGADHRVLTIGGRLVAIALRTPASVTGDGHASVRELVALANEDPRRGLVPFERPLEQIVLDDEALDQLRRAGLTPDSVPAAGTAVRLRGSANLSRGGTAVDVTDQVHPDNRAMFERAARLTGVDVAGIDFITPNIGKSWREVPSAILEVNTFPALRPHYAANPERDVCGPVIATLFAEKSDGRVPLAGLLGTAGSARIAGLVTELLGQAGLVAAQTSTTGAWIGAEQLSAGDSANGAAAEALLLDPAVGAGVFSFAPAALARGGLWLDRLDVAAVAALDDPAEVDAARVLVANARQLVVLSAEDPACLALAAAAGEADVLLVSEDAANPALAAHRAAGGLVAFAAPDGQLVLATSEAELVEPLPAGLPDGAAAVADDALFALAIAYGLGRLIPGVA